MDLQRNYWVSNEHLGVFNENMGVSNENVGVSNGNMGSPMKKYGGLGVSIKTSMGSPMKRGLKKYP